MRKIVLLFLLLITVTANAQCALENRAYQGGEQLSYKLYFNWKFVWITAGTASMSTTKSKYNGNTAYRTSLITRSSKKVDKYFMMRDTLLCYTTEDCLPLYHRKGSHEGSRYYVDEVWYTYKNGTTHLKQHAQTASGDHRWKEGNYHECFCDMMSLFLKARNFDASSWEKGHTERMPICDGDDVKVAYLRYNGTKTIKGEDDVKYRCLDLSYLENEGKKKKEICRFFVTDDLNHLPIRIDLFLRFGTAKAYISSMKGVRNPVTAIVR